MTEYDLVIQNGTIVAPEIGRLEADIGIDGEVIDSIASPGTLHGTVSLMPKDITFCQELLIRILTMASIVTSRQMLNLNHGQGWSEV